MSIKVKDVVKQLESPAENVESKVDSLIFGDENDEVKGILVSFIASQYVIEYAQKIGANLIISHEGIFFSHTTNERILKDNEVYTEKLELIKQSEISIYRFHDYVHKYNPDQIAEGLVQKLNWNSYVEAYKPISTILTIPPMSGEEIAKYVKDKLDIPFVRVVGDLASSYSRIGLLVGYRGGGETAIPLFEKEDLDLIIIGEGPEWETPEYVRDAVFQGKKKALIMLGHAVSEEPGMEFAANLLQYHFPSIPVTFLSEKQHQIKVI